jgi:hypothetical protein
MGLEVLSDACCVLWVDPAPCEDGGERGELGDGTGEATGGEQPCRVSYPPPDETFAKCP